MNEDTLDEWVDEKRDVPSAVFVKIWFFYCLPAIAIYLLVSNELYSYWTFPTLYKMGASRETWLLLPLLLWGGASCMGIQSKDPLFVKGGLWSVLILFILLSLYMGILLSEERGWFRYIMLTQIVTSLIMLGVYKFMIYLSNTTFLSKGIIALFLLLIIGTPIYFLCEEFMLFSLNDILSDITMMLIAGSVLILLPGTILFWSYYVIKRIKSAYRESSSGGIAAFLVPMVIAGSALFSIYYSIVTQS